MEARGYLEECYKSCRELVQTMCVLTQHDTSEGAKIWRHNVAYRTILLLRGTMAAVEYESQQTNPWEIPELTQDDQEGLEKALFLQSQDSRSSIHSLQHAAEHSIRDECFRAPLLLAYALRKEIMEQRSGAYLEHEFSHVNEELKMLDCVTDFVKGFHGLQKLVETPFPFPLVQMTRTFLFVWVFTLSLVLCHDVGNYPFDPLLMIFLTTFGFIGALLLARVILVDVLTGVLHNSYAHSHLPSCTRTGIEFVCLELDDPFGNDPNDFDDLGMAQLVFEDIYISIYKLDGTRAASQLRRKIVARIKRGTALQNFQDDYQHGYSPTQDETIDYDRRLGFARDEDPFIIRTSPVEATPKKKKRMTIPTVKMLSCSKRMKNNQK